MTIQASTQAIEINSYQGKKEINYGSNKVLNTTDINFAAEITAQNKLSEVFFKSDNKDYVMFGPNINKGVISSKPLTLDGKEVTITKTSYEPAPPPHKIDKLNVVAFGAFGGAAGALVGYGAGSAAGLLLKAVGMSAGRTTTAFVIMGGLLGAKIGATGGAAIPHYTEPKPDYKGIKLITR